MGHLDWDLCRSLLAVIEAGSLSGAARALDLSQPTIGRQVEALERQLGGPLFTRSAFGLTPTRLALDLEPHARAMAAAAAALTRTASADAQGERGVVRLSASEVVAVEVLPPILAAFHADHPGVQIELSATNRQEDLLRRDADIAVRMTRPTQGSLIARRLGQVRMGFYAHEDYLVRRGTPQSVDDLRSHALIGYDRGPIVPEARAATNIEITPDLFSLRVDNDAAQLAALRAGFGIGVMQVPLARRDPALRSVMAESFGFVLEFWLVMHEALRAEVRVRALYDRLAEALTAYSRPSD